MGILDFFCSTPKKRTLGDISADELNRERITWQSELNRFEREESRLTQDETQLKNEYAGAESDQQKRSIARKIQDGRMRLKNLSVKITHCNKMVQVANNFLMIKENKEFFERAGVLSVLNGMDVTEIEKYVNEATADGMFQADKLATLLQAQEDGMAQFASLSGEPDLDSLMKELDQETVPIRQEKMGEKADSALDALQRELDAKANAGIESINKTLNPPEN